MSKADSIDAILPQTQCGGCGYAGCRPYAEALACGDDTIDKCPPGGVSVLLAIADLLGVDAAPYISTVSAQTRKPSVAIIREEDCIGCTKCIQACPVDAIIGAAKHMHSVVADLCTGCGLCIEPCPVDCIDEVVLEEPIYSKDQARSSYHARILRQEAALPRSESAINQADILAALQRVQQKKQ